MDSPTKLISVNVFVWRAYSFCKFISDYIINKLIDIIKITDDMFSDDMITFVIPSIILF